MSLLATPALAQPPDEGSRERFAPSDAPYDVTAESLEYDRAREVYVARGNVRITQPGRTLLADWVAFSNRTGRGIASGNVIVREGGDELRATLLEFEIDSSRGVVLDGDLDAAESEFRMTGREIRKTGETTYVFEGGTFTTCRCPGSGPPPWRVRAERTEIDVDGRGVARNATFEVFGLPVAWLPWVSVPLRDERQTGLLFPEIGAASRTGLDVGLPFFWAPRPELGVIVTPRWLSDRGVMPHAALEYALPEGGGGELEASFIHDDEIDPDDPDTPFSENRWAIEWIHAQPLPGPFRAGVDARFFSDNSHPFDFRDLQGLRAERFAQSVAFLEAQGGPAGLGTLALSMLYADDLQNPDDLDRDRVLLHRMPQLELLAAPRRLLPGLPLVAALEADYAYYWSRERATREYPGAIRVSDLFLDTGIDGIPNGEERNALGLAVPGDAHGDDGLGGEGDGRFQEGEPLVDRGHRVLLNPRLALPFRLFDVIEVWPEAGWHGTFYQTREQSSELRSLFTGLVDVRTRLRGELPLPFVGRARHVLEPRLAWSAVSSDDQDRNPLLLPPTGTPQERVRQLALVNVVRDPADRIRRRSQVTLALGNRFYTGGGDEELRLLADATLSLAYDFEHDDLGSLFLDGAFDPTTTLGGRFNLGVDLEESRIDEALLRFGWRSPAGHDFGLAYRYLREPPRVFEAFRFDDERFDEFEGDFRKINQITASARWALTDRWALTARGGYAFEESLLLGARGGFEYLSACRCWALAVEVGDERGRGVDLRVRYTLLGLGDDRIRPFDSRRASRRGEVD